MRPLIELAYAGSGVYAHDAAVPLAAIPQLALARDLGKLDEEKRASALVALRRRRNYVDDRLRAVVKIAEAGKAA